ncbi:MAG: hypothetical protein M4579_004097 [Chaenotheca gracillima]|nr:MAG: hypothetical protein M4579_004097 [Chaenotheca gracillima]
MSPFRHRSPFTFKVLTAVFILFFFISSTWIWDSLPQFPIGLPVGLGGVRKIQFDGFKGGVSSADREKADHVRDAMKRTFWKYRERAWGEDDVKPVTGGYRTSRNGWGAFIVDTSTTLPFMGLWEEFRLEVDHIVNKIDFTNASGLVDPFETTIRYLGALVSLTDLIDNNFDQTAGVTKELRDRVLGQAVVLATKLGPGFDSPTGMVWPRVNFTHNKPSGDPPDVLIDPVKAKWLHPAIGPARAGSNILENKALSKLTKNKIYAKNATKAWSPLVWNPNHEEWPGIVEGPIDIFTAKPVGFVRSWEGGHDSYYEYLIKAHILNPHAQHSKTYRDRWVQAAESLREHLATRSNATVKETGQGRLYIGKWDNGTYVNVMGHLSCFAPGNLILGGRYLKRDDILRFGLELLDTCHHTYDATATRIGPETFHWHPVDRNVSQSPLGEYHQIQVDHFGYWATGPMYRLRPEYVESLFYAWRITGDRKYRKWAWDAFSAIESVCRAEYGYAGIRDVFVAPVNVTRADYTESFWGAETLKYLYLTFADTNVGTLDKWVYSTEGHPFRIF